MLTLLYGYDDLRATHAWNQGDLRFWLAHMDSRLRHIQEMKNCLCEPRYAAHHREIERDIEKLQLINVLSSNLLKKVIGVEDRSTRAIKFRDPVVIQTLDKKLIVNNEIQTNVPSLIRKRFESRLVKQLDDWTVLYTDINRIIAKFAIMD